MFQVLFPCKRGSIEAIQEIMPSGWVLVACGQFNYCLIKTQESGIKVGSLTYLPLGRNVKVSVDESDPLGENFWRDFAKKYPEFNPFDLRHGVLYQSGKVGVYQLDELPQLDSEVLDRVAHYGYLDQAYYVTFFLGDWHYHDEIKVQSFCKIEKYGRLGPKLPMQYFSLSK